MSKELTRDEVRQRLIVHAMNMIDYWATLEGNYDCKYRLEGVVFSLFAALDGCSMATCGFRVIPHSTEEDKRDYIEEGMNYYPVEKSDLDQECDIGGVLHDVFSSYNRTRKT